MMQVNLGLGDMVARLSHERRIAVPFYRDDRKVACIQLEPSGPVLRELPADSFYGAYTKLHEEPVLSVVLKLVRAVRTCYLPGSRVLPTLMEIFNMAITDGSSDLESLTQAQLTEHYNTLAKAAQRLEVKGFKDKATAVKRIKDLQAGMSELTEAQKRAAAEKDCEVPAAGKKSVAKAVPATKKDAAQSKRMASAAAVSKTSEKKTEAKAGQEKKQRGSGIGVFCCELIASGKSNEETLAAVKTKFPGAATSASSVAWYRNKLKNEGKLG